MDINLFGQADAIIKNLYGKNAEFREGQYEAIEATLKNKRTLVVQKTGWGKSLVYFACTKILRQNGKGATLVISPLLVLMQNQTDAAEKLGLKCSCLNCLTKDNHNDIIEQLKQNELDLLFITPETLFGKKFQEALPEIQIGLLVIDEAHCISDWGHDFRLEYGRLYKVIGSFFQEIPILATTATANNRVIVDLTKQFGENVFVSRGPLTRGSLTIQVLKLNSKADRYAWILQHINEIPGSGIIYCLTKRDCDHLSEFLNQNGISAREYYSQTGKDERNAETEKMFYENKIKVIVATVKLGMGYDKGDISFVIHFQQPSNIVAYYQQIGRAGRNIDRAYAILMSGTEDDDILNYFIETAFPKKEEHRNVYDYIRDKPGAKLNEITSGVNFSEQRIRKTIYFLENDGQIYKDGYNYYISVKPYFYDEEYYNEVIAVKKNEKEQMSYLISTQECYSKFIVNALDDVTASACGNCSNCIGQEVISSSVDTALVECAKIFINDLLLVIEPRRQWAKTAYTGQTSIRYKNEYGLALSKYGDIGYGELVKRDKYNRTRFCDELVGKSREVLLPIIKEKHISAITFVPSLRSSIVEDFTKRLANSCGIPFKPLLGKTAAGQQKTMQNSSFQCENAYRSFFVLDELDSMPESVILVDDVVDSKWTLTVCGYKLMERGCSFVYPFALADSSNQSGDE